MRCPKCEGLLVKERYGFLWLSWHKCINCGWHGEWEGRDPERLPEEIEVMVAEVERVGRERARERRVNIRLASYKF